MVEQIILVLLFLTLFFVFYFNFGFKVARLIGRRVCPVCFAVGSTWLILLVARYAGILEVNKPLIAILLAESVVGIANLVEEFAMVRRVNLPEPLVKFGIIVFGTFAVATFALVQEYVGLVLFVPIILFGIFALTPVPPVKKATKVGPESILESGLKKCC